MSLPYAGCMRIIVPRGKAVITAVGQRLQLVLSAAKTLDSCKPFGRVHVFGCIGIRSSRGTVAEFPATRSKGCGRIEDHHVMSYILIRVT